MVFRKILVFPLLVLSFQVLFQEHSFFHIDLFSCAVVGGMSSTVVPGSIPGWGRNSRQVSSHQLPMVTQALTGYLDVRQLVSRIPGK